MDWVPQLLAELARYPFKFSSGLAAGHTLPVDSEVGGLWQGYVLAQPLLETPEFNPLNVFLEPPKDNDYTFFVQVVGLRHSDLEWAIRARGQELLQHLRASRTRETLEALSCLDVRREPLSLPK